MQLPWHVHIWLSPDKHTHTQRLCVRQRLQLPQPGNKKNLSHWRKSFSFCILLAGMEEGDKPHPSLYWHLPPVRDERKEVQELEGLAGIRRQTQTVPLMPGDVKLCSRINAALEPLPEGRTCTQPPSPATAEKQTCQAISQGVGKKVSPDRVRFWTEIFEVMKLHPLLPPWPPAVTAWYGLHLLKPGCGVNVYLYVYTKPCCLLSAQTFSILLFRSQGVYISLRIYQ